MLENEQPPGWLAEVKAGATTVWENWDGEASRNHYSPGAVCEWLYSTVCGIQVEGENCFTIRPLPGGSLTRAEASYQSLYGVVTSRWKKTDGGFVFEVVIPPNTRAEVELPSGERFSAIPGTLTETRWQIKRGEKI
jgi:alpha-L-rhamnosidase